MSKLQDFNCCVDGCERKAMYKRDRLCQMHYFRRMRNGTFDTVLKAEPRRNHSNGYILVHHPGHPLAQKNNYVYEHRFVMYEKYGDNLPDCELCGKETSWEPYTTHIDHIDNNRSNNATENLRPLCNACNVMRSPKRLKKNNQK